MVVGSDAGPVTEYCYGSETESYAEKLVARRKQNVPKVVVVGGGGGGGGSGSGGGIGGGGGGGGGVGGGGRAAKRLGPSGPPCDAPRAPAARSPSAGWCRVW